MSHSDDITPPDHGLGFFDYITLGQFMPRPLKSQGHNPDCETGSSLESNHHFYFEMKASGPAIVQIEELVHTLMPTLKLSLHGNLPKPSLYE